MHNRVKHKWRPPLALVIGGTLFAIFAVPVMGLTYFRWAGNVLGWGETALIILAIALVLTLVMAFLLWRLVLRPVWSLTRHAQAMKAGQEVAPPRQFGTMELGKLGRSVIDMGEALNARARSLSAYSDHVTHELKSPLSSLSAAIELLSDPELAPSQRQRLLQTAEQSAQRMTALLEDLNAHAKARWSAQPGQCDLSVAVEPIRRAGLLTVTIVTSGVIPMSEPDLSRVLTHLASNAAEHGATELRLSVQGSGLTISDNGPGIAQGDAARIFDPFFTTKRETGGTGMGLSIVRALVEAAGGRIRLLDRPDGAYFSIEF